MSIQEKNADTWYNKTWLYKNKTSLSLNALIRLLVQNWHYFENELPKSEQFFHNYNFVENDFKTAILEALNQCRVTIV